MVDALEALKETKDYSLLALAVMQAKPDAACSAPELADEDGVIEAYDQVVNSITDLIARIDRLVAVVTEQVTAIEMTPLQRKLARNRSALLSQETLNSTAKANMGFLVSLGKAIREK